MYNKIASLILNAAKANGLSDVFVAQPDSLKESLAGKIFVLAEISGKKTDGRKIFDFLTMSLNDNYYNDEKILFRGKIEGLKIENIFEVAVTKTNKDLEDFLATQKIKINPAATSITIGVIYENKLHFANFGRNRALLVYNHDDDYEIINVETTATDAPLLNSEDEEGVVAKTPKLFSSVVSGEVPVGSYFIFTSEALPEYLSGKDLIDIVTKLPPMTAAEQIKSILTKINTYIPFLGIIIKNTAGVMTAEIKEEAEEEASVQRSISSLNYTEQKTEQMLAPANLFNFSKIFSVIKQFIKNLQPLPPSPPKKYLNTIEQKSPEPLDLGTIKSMNVARSDSFLIKEKIFFKKKSGRILFGIKESLTFIGSLFNFRSWSKITTNLRTWIQSLSSKNRLLFWTLGALILIFVISVSFTNWNHKRQLAIEDFNNRVTAIETQTSDIEAHLLYNDNIGAGKILLEAQTALSVLPQDTKEQQDTYQRLNELLSANADKIEKIVHIDNPQAVNDLSGLGINNLVFIDSKIYAADNDSVYELTANSSSSVKTIIEGAKNLSKAIFNDKDSIYYWDDNKISTFNIKTKTASSFSINDVDTLGNIVSFKIFTSQNNIYLLSPENKQIYRYARSGNTYGQKTNWLDTGIDISQAKDLAIDGNIYILDNNANVQKFYTGEKQDYQSARILPVMTNASKLTVSEKYLYFWETNSKRLVVLSKEKGLLMNQYQMDSLDDLKDFSIDETNKIAYILSGEKIYEVPLNQ